MDLFLRKVQHPQARNNFRVIIKTDDGEVEIGSIGMQNVTATASIWTWGIDTVIPMRDIESEGSGRDLPDCMRQFRKAWERFAADEANLTAFIDMKRKRR
jgi:hypothetical protein